jgi:hypothetical protein
VIGAPLLPADLGELRRVVQVGEDRLLGRPPSQGGAGSVASSELSPLVVEGTVEVLRGVHDGHAAP